jgi:hypothetical protein
VSYFAPETDPLLYSCGGPKGCDAPPPAEDLLARLNVLRLRLDRPVIVSSGPRCAYWNKKKGGTSTSDHLTGEGADLACATSAERWQILAAIFQDKTPLFTRLGIGKTFVHVGLTTRNPGRLVWHYY